MLHTLDAEQGAPEIQIAPRASRAHHAAISPQVRGWTTAVTWSNALGACLLMSTQIYVHIDVHTAVTTEEVTPWPPFCQHRPQGMLIQIQRTTHARELIISQHMVLGQPTNVQQGMQHATGYASAPASEHPGR